MFWLILEMRKNQKEFVLAWVEYSIKDGIHIGTARFFLLLKENLYESKVSNMCNQKIRSIHETSMKGFVFI